MEQSGLRAKDIAERLGITEGRVSQVLNGDGNIRVATLGKFLSAMGFQPSVAATSRDKGVVIEGRPSRLGPSRDHDAAELPRRHQRVSRRVLTPHL
jgi:transcriptional regulator with XRE-family HTH domain